MAGKGGGGAWKVAYADFVTAMMAFFMVMWITAQNNAVKENIAQYFDNPLGTEKEARASSVHGMVGGSAPEKYKGEQAGQPKTHKPGEGRVGKRDPSKRSDAAPIPLRIFERLGKTRGIGTMVVFEERSAELDEEAENQLAGLLPDLLGKPNKIEIRGHADPVIASGDGGETEVWMLCMGRCRAVMQFLIEQGVEPDRFRLSQDGIFEPYSKEERMLYKELNSRVEVFAISEFTFDYRESVEDRAGDFVDSTQAAPNPHDAVRPEEEAHGDGHGGGHGAGHEKPDPHGAAKPGAGGHGAAEHGAGGHGAAAGHGAKSGHAPKTAHEDEAPHDDGHGGKAPKTGQHQEKEEAAAGHAPPAKH